MAAGGLKFANGPWNRPSAGRSFEGWPTFRHEHDPSKSAFNGRLYDSHFVNYSVAHCGKRTKDTCKFEILPSRPHAMSVLCLGRQSFHLSTGTDTRKPSCAVERIVKEAICPLRNPTRESSL